MIKEGLAKQMSSRDRNKEKAGALVGLGLQGRPGREVLQGCQMNPASEAAAEEGSLCNLPQLEEVMTFFWGGGHTQGIWKFPG